MIERLAARLPAEVREAFVFGSRARGKSTPRSDLDVALVVDEAWSGDVRGFQRVVSDLAFALSDEVSDGELALQLVPIFPADRNTPIWRRIQQEGVRVCPTRK